MSRNDHIYPTALEIPAGTPCLWQVDPAKGRGKNAGISEFFAGLVQGQEWVKDPVSEQMSGRIMVS